MGEALGVSVSERIKRSMMHSRGKLRKARMTIDIRHGDSEAILAGSDGESHNSNGVTAEPKEAVVRADGVEWEVENFGPELLYRALS